MKISKKDFKELFRYGVIGIVTVIVNILIYFILSTIFNIDYIISTIFSWLIAVIFSFLGNKYFVFQLNSSLNFWKELNYFMLTRYITGILDIIVMFIGVDIFKYNDVIIKIISNIIIIVLNYILARYFVFKNNNTGG
ncbi:GtrA-like protein [uncultured Leptotrichia sp.]|uniref:GtrA family protein n=1 Tax=uncultured Leptotrichia sp. TaxID=159271 RepID=UPI001A5B0001|nr:GtrA family protein [uncultured Leptotrichia sp.]VTX49122.1 GtrA-like protein [uncultured Leptotrichia sp.]